RYTRRGAAGTRLRRAGRRRRGGCPRDSSRPFYRSTAARIPAMRLAWVLVLLACAVPAHAQERFAGPRDIYSFEIPPGWTRAAEDSQADAVFAAPQGAGKLYA